MNLSHLAIFTVGLGIGAALHWLVMALHKLPPHREDSYDEHEDIDGKEHYKLYKSDHWACHTSVIQPHPWEPIPDVACGYLHKSFDPGCVGCHRNRDDWPGEQLSQLGNRIHPNALKESK